LNFAALVIGSMSPDAGYFIGERSFAKLAHHPIGTVVFDIPTGLILLGIFYLIRRELCFILPAPHRNQLTPLAHRNPVFTVEALFIAIVSILIGAWTHIIWDQFTHDSSFLNRHFAPLRVVLLHIGAQQITISYILQYISTIIGAALLAWYYCKWLRSRPPAPTTESDTWRYLLIFGLALFSLAAGIAVAIHLSAPVHEFKTLREFVYIMGVSAVSVFSILVVASAILCYRRKLATTNL
jgi:hypothetical protein